jgi:hypothetical protein
MQYINQQIYLIKYKKYNHKTRFVISMKLLHVSAPECHPQGVYEHTGSKVRNSTSGKVTISSKHLNF